MSQDKLEQALEHLINEENEAAEELLHDYYVGLARQVWSDLVESDEIEEDEIVDEAEEEDLDEDFGSEDDEAAFLDDIESDSEEIESEEYFGEDDDEEDEGDDDMDAGDMDAAEDAIMNVEDALAELKDVFAGIMGDEAPADDAPEAPEMPDMEEEVAFEEAEEELDESSDDSDDLREYTEKVNTAMPDGSDASAKSPVKDAGNEHDSKPHPTDTSEEKGGSAPSSGDFGGGTTQDAKMNAAPKPKMNETRQKK